MAPPVEAHFSVESVLSSIIHQETPSRHNQHKEVRKFDFPEGFIFGTATAAYQVEGAALEGGRGPTIWDTFTRLPGKISDGSNGDISCDQYHRYVEDVDLLSNMGFDAYRFSISWSRIFPDGFGNFVNEEGIAYYNALIDTLLSKGIKPFATLYHWDLPQALHDAFGGWLSREIVNCFAIYAETCFAAFGDRVKHWITLNEPLRFSLFGYGLGIHAPGRSSDRKRSSEGDSLREPYLTAHNSILAHAAAADVYNRKFRAQQGGKIGLALDSEWGEPLTNSSEDREAAQRHVEFHLGWFLDPIYFGDYPASMRAAVGDRLPQFSAEERELLSKSLDFVGLNHYTTRYVTVPPCKPEVSTGWSDDSNTLRLYEVDGKPIGDKGASYWMYIVPWGISRVLNWITLRYNRPALYVTENGMDDESCPSKSLADCLNDSRRVKFYQEYLSFAAQAIREGADLRGYFAWSLMDNFEWQLGYSKRFGIVYVDYANNQKRYPKNSALWFSRFLKNDLPLNQQDAYTEDFNTFPLTSLHGKDHP